MAEPDEEEREKFCCEMVLFLKFMGLDGFFPLDLGIKFLFLNKDPIAIEADKLLVRGPQIESVGRVSTHGTSGQEPPCSTIPGHLYQKAQEYDGE